MVNEQERPPSPEDQEEIHTLVDIIKASFKKLLQKIRELGGKKKREGRLENEEFQLLVALQKEKADRSKEFFRQREDLSQKRTAMSQAMEEAISAVEKADAADREAKLRQAEAKIREKKQESRGICSEEEAKITDPRFQGVVEDAFGETIGKKERDLLRKEQARPEAEAEDFPDGIDTGEAERAKNKILRDVTSKRAAELEKRFLENPQDSQAISDLTKLKSYLRELGGGGTSPYELTPQELYLIKTKGKLGADKVFEDILNRFGLDPGRHFREADLTAQSRWISFMLVLKDNPDLLLQYTLRFGFQEQAHNLDIFLRGHSPPAKLPELLANFESRMLDVTLRQEGVAAAFRAYEQAFHRLMLIEGKIEPSLVGLDPDQEKTWIYEWVKGQVHNTMESYCKEHHLPYDESFEAAENSIIRTGWKVFVFTLRGDEIQATSTAPRLGPEAPWHEDLWRRLDPLAMPLKYWVDRKPGAREFFNSNAIFNEGQGAKTTAMHFLFSNEKKLRDRFKTVGEYAAAVEELEEKGGPQMNFFEIGGILSVSDWRSTVAMKDIPEEWHQFMGIEMDRKLLQHQYKDVWQAKEEALQNALIRNPMVLFRLAGEADQNAILQACGVNPEDPEAKKMFLGKVYDTYAQGLQSLVYDQEKEMQRILKLEGEEKEIAIKAFTAVQVNRGVENCLIGGEAGVTKDFIEQIRGVFKPGSPEFERLVKKDYPFSMGTEDTPMALMRFLETGDVGLQRRFRDVGAAAQATEAFWAMVSNLPNILQKDDKMIEALQQLRMAFDSYGPGHDMEGIMLTMASRILDLTASDDIQHWLPWPFSTLRDKYGLTSKAEKLFGQYHMSMGNDEQRLLVEKMIAGGLFEGMDPRKVRKILYKEHSLRRIDIWWDNFLEYWMAVPVGLTAAAVIALWEGTKKDLEEMAKES